MTTGSPSISAAGASGLMPVPAPTQHEGVKEKRDLASWWKNFKGRDKKSPEQAPSPGIFGVPLQTSIRYANVAISLLNDEGQSYIYGYVPIVVAKCGVYLKEKATETEGIFRLAGSEKRIKELKVAFDSPDRYGKGLDWAGFTVHDAANILRRYFNQLPEPIIPLEFYERFRDPLKHHQQQAVSSTDAAQAPNQGEFQLNGAIKIYQRLITELPPLNRQLLLYILDLLAVFASKSDLNKMTTPNLAAIFQPGILSHPQHDMAPKEYRLSQDVLIFLIENQDSFLIGMSGTAADAETVRDVQSGSPTKPSTPTTPNRTQTVIGRSGSNSTAGGESVRKWGSIRRNVSVSSKHSKKSEVVTPVVTAAPGTPTNGVHRSNTVPSRRNVSTTASPRFSREKTSDPPTPTATTTALSTAVNSAVPATIISDAVPATTAPDVLPANTGLDVLSATTVPDVSSSPTTQTQTVAQESSIPTASASQQSTGQAAPVAQQVSAQAANPTGAFLTPSEIASTSSSDVTTPRATLGSDTASTVTKDYQSPKKDTTPLLYPPGSSYDRTPDRSTSNPPSSTPGRGFLGMLKQSPGSENESRKPNKLQKRRTPGSALSSAHSSSHSLDEHAQRVPISPVNAPSLAAALQQSNELVTTSPVQDNTTGMPRRETAGSSTRPPSSPPRSFNSHTDTSDADMVGDDMPTPHADQPEKTKRQSRWRYSRSTNRVDQPSTPSYGLGTAGDQAMSRSTIGSGGSQTRRSFQETAPLNTTITDQSSSHASVGHSIRSPTSETVFSDSERERKGPMSWIRNKLQERKDKDAEKRFQSPERGHERSRSKADLVPTPQLPVMSTPARSRHAEQVQAQTQAPTSHSTIASVTAQASSTGNPEMNNNKGPLEPRTEGS